MYTIFFFYPLLPFLVSIYFKDISDVEAAALVSGTLLSWYMCVMWVSADANLKIMKALGISIND